MERKVVVFFVLLVLFFSCEKDERNEPIVQSDPVIKTLQVNTNKFIATCICTVMERGGYVTQEQGVAVSLDENIDSNDVFVIDHSKLDTFQVELTDLDESTTYYVAGYVKTIKGTFFGSSIEFATADIDIPETITDNSYNIYHTVKIGNQVWTVENFKVDHYNNGDPIEHYDNDSLWLNASCGAYCYLENNASNNYYFGKLYNAYALSDERGIIPEGWRLPTYEDYEELKDFVKGDANKIKSNETEFWQDFAGTNETGFTARPSGSRSDEWGNFFGGASFWIDGREDGLSRYFSVYYDSLFHYDSTNIQLGACIRLIME